MSQNTQYTYCLITYGGSGTCPMYRTATSKRLNALSTSEIMWYQMRKNKTITSHKSKGL